MRALGMGENDGWTMFAACRGLDPALFYPERGEAAVADHVIRTVCAVCPVSLACLDRGMSDDQGVWGGWPGELRVWIRRAGGHQCLACGERISGAVMFCHDACLLNAMLARGKASKAVAERLTAARERARLGIANQKGRRLAEAAGAAAGG